MVTPGKLKMIPMYKIILMAVVCFLSGCGVNYSIPAEDQHSAKQADAVTRDKNQNLVTFKVNGKEVRTTVWSVSRFAWKNKIARIFMNITSNMHDDKRTINVNLDGSVPGKYPLAESGSINIKSYGSYYPDYIQDQVNSYSFTSGIFELTEVDTVKNKVNGSFYGKVKNIKGDSLEITEGRIINGFLKVDITNY
jgi:hypothetical protein